TLPAARCGDAECAAGETCANCPLDCGFCCGDGDCRVDHGETCATCPADCSCAAGDRCDAAARTCVPACVPDCGDRVCGDDGCEGACGECEDDDLCTADGRCTEAPAECGDQVCEAPEDCFTCPADCGACCGDGACTAGVGETCATCPADCGCGDDERCDIDARRCVPAECAPQCQGRSCGPDGCDGFCGMCDPGELCDIDAGRCRVQCVPACEDRECGDDGCDGTCGACGDGYLCTDGHCEEICVPDCDGRQCGDDGCNGTCGVCNLGELCSIEGQCVGGGAGCNCDPGDICIDGRCRSPGDVCGAPALDGLCPGGQICLGGLCTDVGAGCSVRNPNGICPVGEMCRGGACGPADAATACNDNNVCTEDVFDPIRNACGHPPAFPACDDGNGCTVDRCQDGRCFPEPIPGCVAPPTVDPVVSPTNQAALILAGGKTAGSGVRINGADAVPESQALRWEVNFNLTPGENVYRIRGVTAGVESAERVVRVVYDINPPTVAISPSGGVFLDGITVTAAASEPATVYYTTDGSTPDAFSQSFDGMRTFRIFDDTVLSVRARDRAGNWQARVFTVTFEISGDGNGWTRGSTLPVALADMAVAHDDRRVVALGGTDGVSTRGDAFLYEPIPDRWRALPPMPFARAEASAAIVDGSTYIIGGVRDGVPSNQVARLPTDESAWELRRSMPTPRFGAQAVRVGGRVHVLGGRSNGGAVVTAHEVYEADIDRWRNDVAPMPRGRYAFATVLVGELIYCVGGIDNDGQTVADVDVYDTGTNSWQRVATMPTPRSHLTATLQDNSLTRVIGGHQGIVIAGGRGVDGAITARVEEYVIDRRVWRNRAPLPAPRSGAGAITTTRIGPLDDDHVTGFVVGGRVVAVQNGPETVTDTTIYYAHDEDHVRRPSVMPESRFMHATAAVDGRVYVLGGRSFQELTTFYVFDPEVATWRALPALPSVQNDLAAVGHVGRVWAIGGADAGGNPLATLRSYDPIARRWQDHRSMLVPRRDPVAAVVGGEIYVAGGDNNGAITSVEIYDPATDRWRNGAPLPSARTGAVAVAYGGAFYVAGGRDVDGMIRGTLFKLQGGAWSQLEVDAFPVADATAALIAGRLNLFAGRMADGTITDRHWSYDLENGRLGFEWVPSSRLLASLDHSAAATVNGE
ncbi:MAG: chitobiase/beta-hexosaminidase C-terminal domain-containing protein, partial [Myxococcales bacterium]|nr:chitobiase/beta-hexosaminidase C-terminal domain-containing protein [Myxococcales bacterium]